MFSPPKRVVQGQDSRNSFLSVLSAAFDGVEPFGTRRDMFWMAWRAEGWRVAERDAIVDMVGIVEYAGSGCECCRINLSW